jgi:hypothetical protein
MAPFPPARARLRRKDAAFFHDRFFLEFALGAAAPIAA